MKIIGVSASPKKRISTTRFALEKALESVEKQGVETLHINLAEYAFNGCHDCGLCRSKLTCSQKDDYTEILLPLLSDPEVIGFIFATPVYFGGMSSQLKAFFDRTLPIRRNGFLWDKKVAGTITVGAARHGGQELAAFDIIKAALISGMTIVPDASPTSHFGGALWSKIEGGIEADELGILQAQNIGKRVAEVAVALSPLNQ